MIKRFCDRCKDEIKIGDKYSRIGDYDLCRKKCFAIALKGLGVDDKIESYKEYEEE